MKEMEISIRKKRIFTFCIIMGAISVILVAVSMLTNETLLSKVLFGVVLASYIVLLFCFFRGKKGK